MRMKLLLLLGILYPFLLQAQQEPLPSLTKNPALEKKMTDAVTARYQSDLKGLGGQHRKYLTEIYKERYELILKKISGNEMITDEKSAAYLEQITQQILRANPSLQVGELRVLFSNAWWPNASSMGEGTIIFNIGLFHRLQNESQVAFVLGHEIAHYYLNHSNDNIHHYVNTVYSDSFQKQLKSIQKSYYRQNQQIESVAQHLTFRNRRHSRAYEHAADSMAVVLLKNTNYDLNGALSCLALLDSVDRDKFSARLDLVKHFDFPSMRFKKSWTETDALMFAIEKDDAAEKREHDSLKTHPDCATRISKLEGMVHQYNKPGVRLFLVNEQMFQSLVTAFDFEIINASFANDQVSRCLYLTLKMLEAYPNNAHLHTMVGKCLNRLYIKQKAHELGNIVDLPNPALGDEYNQLLQMIQNVRLSEIAGIAFYYVQQHRQVAEKDIDFASVAQTAVEHFKN
jgi:hypothetical protein